MGRVCAGSPAGSCVLSSSGPQATLGVDVCATHWILETHSSEHAERSSKGPGEFRIVGLGAELLLSAEL